MSIRYNLDCISNEEINLEGSESRSDLKKIIEQFKGEGFRPKDWYLTRITRLYEDKSVKVYCFEDMDKNHVDILISKDSNMTPHYFKGKTFKNYRLYKANSIKEAIANYENPILHTMEKMEIANEILNDTTNITITEYTKEFDGLESGVSENTRLISLHKSITCLQESDFDVVGWCLQESLDNENQQVNILNNFAGDSPNLIFVLRNNGEFYVNFKNGKSIIE
ncbi:hypothetical protein FOL75_26635 [Bacillus thuringiensis]|uniref:hypothetical protein n=1 Tax=Bacillus thuringiensis TaxID=1428 RepID=UPI002853F4CE|nr:hypothetical protein [Bacillus thuringiensis]MDR5025369.1 hypothetical protein [Bacillus thuringiensis]